MKRVQIQTQTEEEEAMIGNSSDRKQFTTKYTIYKNTLEIAV